MSVMDRIEIFKNILSVVGKVLDVLVHLVTYILQVINNEKA
nr:MAG TPA: hypothetical protein [Microviridae sp.]